MTISEECGLGHHRYRQYFTDTMIHADIMLQTPCYRRYVTNTMVITYLSSTSATAGSAAEIAALRKEGKFRELSVTHNFMPIALETLRPVGSQA